MKRNKFLSMLIGVPITSLALGEDDVGTVDNVEFLKQANNKASYLQLMYRRSKDDNHWVQEHSERWVRSGNNWIMASKF